MKILRSSQYDAIKSEILSRGDLDYKDINIAVENIVKNVKENGDMAVLEYTSKFDGAKISSMEVTKEEMNSAWERAPESLKTALTDAANNIRRFHQNLISIRCYNMFTLITRLFTFIRYFKF